MNNIRFTKDQQKVIETHNRNILVSAAAGSGKTAVLVERIIQMVLDEEKGCALDQLLVVTFTNAAASEMRERIGEALYKAIERYPEKSHLREQLTLLPSASIMTLHGFCLQIIRNYYYEIDLDPGFSIGDETELAVLRQEVLGEVIESFYQEASDTFESFVNAYGHGKSDKAIESLIMDVYKLAMSHPTPVKWLFDSVSHLDIDCEEAWFDSQYVKVICTNITERLRVYSNAIDKALVMIEEEEALKPMAETFIDYRESVGALMDSTMNPSQLFLLLSQLTFKRSKSAKRGTDKGIVEPVKALLAIVKDGLKGLKEEYGFVIDQSFVNKMILSHDYMKTLITIIIRFKDYYDEAKAKKNLIDFNDIEHFALKILSNDTIANRYKEQFVEIMVDEYQDSNLVQETLVKKVSRIDQGSPNVFMVGDMKQSIYKFRLAKPELFANKYDTYTEEDSLYQKIELHQNFRSRQEVLSFTNYIFKQVMSRHLGDVNYDDHAALYQGAKYALATDQYKTKIRLIERMGTKGMSPQELEAHEVAKEIETLMSMTPPLMVYDKALAKERKVMYKDMAILLRTMTGWSEVFVEILNDYGIPVKSQLATGYFDAIEIQTILNALTIVDNPKQDIPLLSVMKSPMFSFTEDELVTIRTVSKEVDYHSALMIYHDSIMGSTPLDQKVESFVMLLKKWRAYEKEMPLHELTIRILRETSYYDYVSLMIGGVQRRANLDMFLEQVYRYEQSSYKGLFDFIRYMSYIKKQSLDMGVAQLKENTVDQVIIMSIHKSKGLEFPIVIVPGLSKQFNKMDLNRSVLMHQDLGFGTDAIMPEKKVKYPLPTKKIIREAMDRELKSEEMRILYVAMTRAREKLILLGGIKDIDKYIKNWCKVLTEETIGIDTYLVKEASCYMDLIVMGLIRHKEMAKHYQHLDYDYRAPIPLSDIAPDIEIQVDHFEHEAGMIEKIDDKLDSKDDKVENELKALSKKVDLSPFDWRYPHEVATNKHVSQSVSELKKNESEPVVYCGPVIEKESIAYEPKFLMGAKPLTGSEKGTIFHKVMDKLSFEETYNPNALRDFMNVLQEKGIITKRELETIHLKGISAFFETNIGKRAREAAIGGRLHKEKPFVMGVEEEGVEGMIMIQGVIDLYFAEEDGLVIVDYKTDYMKDRKESELVDRYRTQMRYYKQALEQSTGINVKEVYLYSVGLKRAIVVDM